MPIIIATSPTVAIIKCPIIENVVRNRWRAFLKDEGRGAGFTLQSPKTLHVSSFLASACAITHRQGELMATTSNSPLYRPS
jgi:hypothetical protein